MTNPRNENETHCPSPEDSGAPRHVGTVGLAGAPNVGKSTLTNRLVGQKVSIVSHRPQTTRERICGIYTDERMQAVLVDIPGITEPRDKLGTVLLDWVRVGLKGCNVILHLRDARRPASPDDAQVIEKIQEARCPAWLVWNKIDQAGKPALPAGDLPYERVFSISALTGQGVDALRDALAGALPIGPLLFDPEQICDRPMRFLVAELVREQLFLHLGQEVPYGTTAFTEDYDEERGDKVYIRVTILTERDAHKPIIIGERGEMLKKIGQGARRQIEELVGGPVYLDLWIKVGPKWRGDDLQLGRLGLKPPKSER